MPRARINASVPLHHALDEYIAIFSLCRRPGPPPSSPLLSRRAASVPATLSDTPDSVWLTEPAAAAPPLRGRVRADLAVVGGGITGLSAAYHFKRCYPDKHIVVLEGQRVGFGASGRSSGFISREYHGWDSIFFDRGAAAVEPYARYAERGYGHLVHTIHGKRLTVTSGRAARSGWPKKTPRRGRWRNR